ncbi:MAG: PIG-L family deacetylase [Selenomonadaceae bacterium]|nr:PIG-L family deacetylase [Selenomonadaceae bacterium]
MGINKAMMDGTLDLSDEDVFVEDEPSDVGNSFFETRCHGLKVLVLAPHPDDEINVAGNMIFNLVQARAKVFVAYTTNGDFDIDAAIRAKEVAQSLEILGVKRDNIIFLGYGDTYNGKGNPHIFFTDKPTTSPAGKIETYPAGEFIDYSYSKHKQHSKYTRQDYMRDLKELILDIEADIIFCVDFDRHADHRMLSLTFEQVMYEILSRPDNNYHPEVYKRLTYATAFTAVRDFYADNLLETKRPFADTTESYDFDIINRANYKWSERVRFPVCEDCREPLINNNPIAKAIFCHKSQHNEWNALGILNSDEVYFERRTDSLTFKAQVESTSGDACKVKDFQIINTNDVDAIPAKINDYLWLPDLNDNIKTLTLQWNQLQQIEQIKIYGSISDDSGIDKLEIKLGNVYKSEKKLSEHGEPLVINFPEKVFANCAEFKIIKTHGQDYGISEIEIFAEKEAARAIKAFINITHNDNFIYDYFILNKIDCIELEVYKFHVDRPIELTATGGNIERDKDKFILHLNSEIVTVRAEVMDEPAIFDQVVIHRVSNLYFWQLKSKQLLERLKIHLMRKFKFLNR